MTLGIPGLPIGVTRSSGPPTANLAAWYRKGAGISSAAGAVSAWADQSNGAWGSLLQATGANKPQLQADGTIVTNGTTQCLATAIFASVAQPLTIYLRVKILTQPAADAYLFDGGTAGQQAVIFRTATPTQIEVFAGTSLASGVTVAGGSYASLAIVFNGAGSYARVNSTISATGNAGAGARTGLIIGANAAIGSLINAQYAEIAAYTGAPSTARDDFMQTYLNSVA